MDLFTRQRRAVCRCSADTLDRQGRILTENFVLPQARSQAVENNADRDAGAANAGLAMDHVGVRDNEVSLMVGHGPSVSVGERVGASGGGWWMGGGEVCPKA